MFCRSRMFELEYQRLVKVESCPFKDFLSRNFPAVIVSRFRYRHENDWFNLLSCAPFGRVGVVSRCDQI